MKTILKSTWNKQAVTVSINEYYHPNGFKNAYTMRITVAETYLLPASFKSGHIHKANIDIIDTLGGLPSYVAHILNNAARQQQRRREQPIKTQLALF